MPKKNVFAISNRNWDQTLLPAKMSHFDMRNSDPAYFSAYHDPALSYSMLNVHVATAVYEYVQGITGHPTDLAIIKVGDNNYAAEHHMSDGSTVLFNYTSVGKVKGAICDVAGNTNAMKPFGKKTGESAELDVTGLYACALMKLNETSQAVNVVLQREVEHFTQNNEFTENLYYLSDAVCGALEDPTALKLVCSGGNVEMMTAASIKLEAYNGTVISGKATILTGGKSTAAKNKNMTFAEAKKEFKSWADMQQWTPEEEMLIPTFPDDYPVMSETMKLCSRYINTHGNRRPMVNFMWRGITSYGKSTGVSMMAALLHMPLLHMTCNSNMETQEFLSNIIPAGDDEEPETASVTTVGDLPTFFDISCDSVSAYRDLTGTKKAHATPDDCMDAYVKRIAENTKREIKESAGITGHAYADKVAEVVAKYEGDVEAMKEALMEMAEKAELRHAMEMCSKSKAEKRLFKQVESNFVKALARGYIVEVQEISRIKDSGVLVGLNEYDRPGAVIPLVDGSTVTRHPNAIVVYTDNVGYSSCRPIDPSVIRRMSFIIDSYEMSKEDAISRVVYNTGFADKDLLDKLYDVWDAVKNYCIDKDITEGSVSLTELEMWAQCVMADGYGNVYDNCIDCVVAKATSVPSEQKEILSSVVSLKL